MAPIDLLNSVLSWYRKDAEKAKPIIPPSTAAILSVAYTLIYVLPLYLSPKSRPSQQLSRDSPSVIRARIHAVTFSCVLTAVLTGYVALHVAKLEPRETLQVLGLWPIHVFDVINPLALTTILFIGPLFEAACAEGRWRAWLTGRGLVQTYSDPIGWRNYVAGPVSEELVFRAFIIPLHIFAKLPPLKLVFLTPLYFGIAHIHHFYEFKLTHPRTPLLPALLRTLLQFTYTSLFGFFAAFVFLRTGSLLAAIVIHAFCNWMGLPRFWGRVEAPVIVGPPDVKGKEDVETSFDAHGGATAPKLGIAWSLVYYVLLVAGAVGFYYNLWKLTASPNALVGFGGRKH